MNFRTIDDLNKTIFDNLYKIPSDVDIIVGVPRSGMLVANLISLYLNLPLTDFNSLLKEEIYESGRTKKNIRWVSSVEKARRILVVEDSSSTGTSLLEVKEKLKGFRFADKVILLTAYVTKSTLDLTDLFFEIIEYPRMFEWNFFHHARLDEMCFDIDGVLCEDPTSEQNDDGPRYVEFIRNAPLKLIPTNKIGYLVTSRLEKYREDTEYWLYKNGIQYGELIMMPYETIEERLQHGSHGIFKGTHYKRIREAQIFVESEKKQAEEIAVISGKMVFCTENHRVYTENRYTRSKDGIKLTVKKILPPKVKVMLKRMLKR